uniref:Uncharacterized protein n=2 Tax=Edwardsiella TaxID=635 RepID=A0A8F5V8T7_EDWPI|nr:hypothetical protein [Edwardsiella tarda]QXO85646.1 hypothetical protein [Edwardsiella piscicida]
MHDFKRFFSLRNFLILAVILYLQYLFSDGTIIGYFKQLSEWLIIPFLSKFIKRL